MKFSQQERQAALLAVCAVADAIKSLGSVPNGELYARVMGYVTLRTYEGIISALKQAGLISESSNVLTWTGPRS